LINGGDAPQGLRADISNLFFGKQSDLT
jgi:hypothetical protein